MNINQEPLQEYWISKYQNEKHCLVKKYEANNSSVIKWFTISGEDMLVYVDKNDLYPKKKFVLKDFSFIESTPLLENYKHCIKFQRPYKKILWLHQEDTREKNFLLNYFKTLKWNKVHSADNINDIKTRMPKMVSSTHSGDLSFEKIAEDFHFPVIQEKYKSLTFSTKSHIISKENKFNFSKNKPLSSNRKVSDEIPEEHHQSQPSVRKMQINVSRAEKTEISSINYNKTAEITRKSLAPHERESCVIGPHIYSGLVSPKSKSYFEDVVVENPISQEAPRAESQKKNAHLVFNTVESKDEKIEEIMKVPDEGENQQTKEARPKKSEPNFYEELRKIKTQDECVTKGHSYMWKYQFEKAKKCFSLYKYEDLLFEILANECNLMEIAITGNEAKIKEVLDELSNLADKANDIDISPKDDLEKYFSNELNKAEIAIFRCAMHFFLGNKFQTLKYIAECWRHYKKLDIYIEKKKSTLSSRNLHRYKFGYGCFNLAFSLIPPSILRLIKLIGISPDKEDGLKKLEECRCEDDIRSNYSVIVLALYTIEFEVISDKACDYLTESIAKWNRCPYFYWISSIVCWKYSQAKDAYFMIKNALWILQSDAQNAVFLLYELGWYYFLNFDWENSLRVFTRIATYAFPERFFNSQQQEIQSAMSSSKYPFKLDPKNCHEKLKAKEVERTCILPHLPQIGIKIAACYFRMGYDDLANKWLLLTPVIHKKYSNFKSKPEEDFSKLASKYLYRQSKRLLVYEIYYFMRYMPKLPDYILKNIIDDIEEYKRELNFKPDVMHSIKKDKIHAPSVEYFSYTMLLIITNSLLGETEYACQLYEEASNYFQYMHEEFFYMTPHIEYWTGRALIAEERNSEAIPVLRSAAKRKKVEFNITNKIKKVLADLE